MQRRVTMCQTGSSAPCGFQAEPGVIGESQEKAKHASKSSELKTTSAMQERLLARVQTATQNVRVGITAEQQHLKEQHAAGPNSGPAAKPREDVLAEKKLDPKEQKRAEKDGEPNFA